MQEYHFWRKVLIAFACVGWTFYAYIDQLNEVIEARRKLPELEKKYTMLEEDKRRLTFVLKRFEHPEKLLFLSKQPEFGHLHAPKNEEVLFFDEKNV